MTVVAAVAAVAGVAPTTLQLAGMLLQVPLAYFTVHTAHHPQG